MKAMVASSGSELSFIGELCDGSGGFPLNVVCKGGGVRAAGGLAKARTGVRLIGDGGASFPRLPSSVGELVDRVVDEGVGRVLWVGAGFGRTFLGFLVLLAAFALKYGLGGGGGGGGGRGGGEGKVS